MTKRKNNKLVYDFDESMSDGYSDSFEKSLLLAFGICVFGIGIPIMIMTILENKIPLTNGWLLSSIGIFLVTLEILHKIWIKKINNKEYGLITLGATTSIKLMMSVPSILITTTLVGLTYMMTNYWNKFIEVVITIIGSIGLVLLGCGIVYGFIWLNNKWSNKMLNHKVKKNKNKKKN